MRQLILLIPALMTLHSYAQQMHIITIDKYEISAGILDSPAKNELLTRFKGRQDNSLRKKWTARTFLLADGRAIIECYDGQAILFDKQEDLKKLDRIRFVKNNIDFLKKNISYKIELSFSEGSQLVQAEKPKRLNQFKTDMPEYYDFEVYELGTGQVLYINKTEPVKSATIFPDLKTLASNNATITEQLYGSEDDEYLMKRLAAGDTLADYEPTDHLLFPKYEQALIKNHKLTLIDTNVFVSSDFYGNLYRSDNGYYILLDDFDQLNVPKTAKIGIGTLRFYHSLDEVRTAQKNYEANKDKAVRSEHFYQKISDAYGRHFPEAVSKLVAGLPAILNFDQEQLAFDSSGMDLVDEALAWNGTNYALNDKWFPAVLAYYGQCYITSKKDGKWTVFFDKESKVWIPGLQLNDGSAAWDWRDFFKDLYEGPIPLRWAGDWDGSIKKMRSGMRIQ